MRTIMYLLSVVLVFALAGFSRAAGAGDMAKENAELKQKLDQLDKELEGLKKTIMEKTGTTEGMLPKPVWSNLDIQLYGYLKLDAAYDTSRIDNGNYAKWVEMENLNENDNEFNMTARETRLGMLINGPDDGEVQSSGRVEVDFYGPGDGINENQARIMMRHAYLKVDWPKDKFNIIAGQTSDVISPLYEPTVNYSVGWWVGNIGYRRPQIRLTKEMGFEGGGSLKLEGALARTIGRDNPFLTGITDSGADAGFPTFQGRVSITHKMFGGQEGTVGISGHWGEEEYETSATGADREFHTWSLNVDYSQPICSKVKIQTEWFTGEDLDAYLGGIGQGVTLSGANQYKEIGSKGGWVAASLGPWNNKRFNVGVGMDDVDSGDVNVGDRTLNRSVFGNVYCALNKQAEVAFELSHWRTEYKGPGDGESLRAQLAFIYKF